MSVRAVCQFSRKASTALKSNAIVTRSFASALPDSITRSGQAIAFPDEYPGQNYAFNWTLNADGVTPTKKSAFRITKPLELKIAGLDPLPKSSTPLKVNATAAKKPGQMKEAGSEHLDFDSYDEISQRCKDLLSLSESLYCPEGDMPGTRTSVRIITNSGSLAPNLLAYLDRAPKKDEGGKSCSITAYVLEDEQMDAFGAYAIEEVGSGDDIRSVAAVVCTGKKISIEKVVAGLEVSLEGLKEDEAARNAEAESKEE